MNPFRYFRSSFAAFSPGRALVGAALAGGLLLTPCSFAWAQGQTIDIGGKNVPDHVYGNGDLPDGGAPVGGFLPDAEDNTVNVNAGGTVDWNAYGGRASSNAAGQDVEAKGNAVNVNAFGTVTGDAYGGYAFSDAAGVNVEANGNAVNVEAGGAVGADAYGGFVRNTGAGGLAQAAGNSVTVDGAVGFYVDGGHASHDGLGGLAKAAGNSVTVDGTAGVTSGGLASKQSTDGGGAQAADNSVTVGGTVAEAYGGHAYSSGGINDVVVEANDNTVKVKAGGTVTLDAYGGLASNGGNGGSARATGNSVTVDGSVAQGALGGFAEHQGNNGVAQAIGNSVAVGGTVNWGALGGGAVVNGGNGLALAASNSVTINSGGTVSVAQGGHAGHIGDNGNAQATGNSVTVNGGADFAQGGDAYHQGNNGLALAADNSVIVNGTLLEAVGGNAAHLGDNGIAQAAGNSVTINSGGTVSGAEIYGGQAYHFGAGGQALATGNRVIINSGGKMDSALVVVGGGTSIFGGHAVNSDAAAGAAAATGNSVTINGDLGANIDVYGGYAENAVSAAATGNTVTIGGNNFGANVTLFGGFNPAGIGDVFTGNTLNLFSGAAISAAHNFEIINFGDIGSANLALLDTTPTGAAPGTLVKLNTGANNIDFTGVITGPGGIEKQGAGILTLSNANDYGGATKVSQGTLAVTGTLGAPMVGGGYDYGGDITNNAALIFNQTADQTLSGVISGTGALTKAGPGLLTLTNANPFSGSLAIEAGALALLGSIDAKSLSLGANTLFDYSGSAAYAAASPPALKNVTVNGLGAKIRPPAGQVTDFRGGGLFFNVPGTAKANDVLLTVAGDADMSGAKVGLATSGRPNLNLGEKLILMDVKGTLTHDLTALTVQTAGGDVYTIQVTGAQLLAILAQVSPTSPAYARLKAYAESRAANLAFLGQRQDFLIGQFGPVLDATSGADYKISGIATLGGGKLRHKTGSHVDVSGLSLLAGLALGHDVGAGRLTLGAFFEGGWGNYDSFNSFSNYASVKGRGDTDYFGGGLMGRYDLGGLYFEGSAQAGRARADFSTNDILFNGLAPEFKSSSNYYSLHGGLGYAWACADQATVDLSAKVLWTRQQGDEVTVHRDRVEFEKADSLRARLGGRATFAVNERVSPYVGAYWEHEFDGKQRARVNGKDVGTPSLKGSSGLGELGLSLKPSPDLPLTLDLGLQGHVGKREGVAGSLQLRFEF